MMFVESPVSQAHIHLRPKKPSPCSLRGIYAVSHEGMVCRVGSCIVRENDDGFLLSFRMSENCVIGIDDVQVKAMDGMIHVMNGNNDTLRFHSKFPVNERKYEIANLQTDFHNDGQIQVTVPAQGIRIQGMEDKERNFDTRMRNIVEEEKGLGMPLLCDLMALTQCTSFDWNYRDDEWNCRDNEFEYRDDEIIGMTVSF